MMARKKMRKIALERIAHNLHLLERTKEKNVISVAVDHTAASESIFIALQLDLITIDEYIVYSDYLGLLY